MRSRPRRKRFPGALKIDDSRSTGEEILHFWRWLFVSKYHLISRFLGDLKSTPSAGRVDELDERLRRALRHGERVYQARSVVNLLLALGVVTAAAGAIADTSGLEAPFGLLERVAALAASVSLALIVLRLAFGRYLERVDVAATFLAMLIAKARTPLALPPEP